MYKWNYHFENSSKPEILSILQQFKEKLLVVSDNDKIEEIDFTLESKNRNGHNDSIIGKKNKREEKTC